MFKKNISSFISGFIHTPQHGVLSRAFSKTKQFYRRFIEPKHFSYSIKRHKSTTPCLVSGFTMIEMVVSVGIFVVMTTIILVNYQKFLSTVSLSTLANEIAVSVRQAQTYGQNVREFGAGTNVFPSYGVYFDSGVTGSFILFADISGGDKQYNGVACGVSGTECLEQFIIQSNASIARLCGNVKTDGKTINDPTAECGLSSLDIAFTRPNPDASIIGVSGGLSKTYSDAEIVLQTARETAEKTVVIWANGQITIE